MIAAMPGMAFAEYAARAASRMPAARFARARSPLPGARAMMRYSARRRGAGRAESPIEKRRKHDAEKAKAMATYSELASNASLLTPTWALFMPHADALIHNTIVM